MFCFLICFYSNTIFYRKHMLASLTLLSVIDPLLCRELYILPCSNSSFTSLINHCCSLCSHYPYCHSISIQEYLHPILFVDFTAFLICILSIFACFCMTRNFIVLILYSHHRFTTPLVQKSP